MQKRILNLEKEKDKFLIEALLEEQDVDILEQRRRKMLEEHEKMMQINFNLMQKTKLTELQERELKDIRQKIRQKANEIYEIEIEIEKKEKKVKEYLEKYDSILKQIEDEKNKNQYMSIAEEIEFQRGQIQQIKERFAQIQGLDESEILLKLLNEMRDKILDLIKKFQEYVMKKIENFDAFEMIEQVIQILEDLFQVLDEKVLPVINRVLVKVSKSGRRIIKKVVEGVKEIDWVKVYNDIKTTVKEMIKKLKNQLKKNNELIKNASKKVGQFFGGLKRKVQQTVEQVQKKLNQGEKEKKQELNVKKQQQERLEEEGGEGEWGQLSLKLNSEKEDKQKNEMSQREKEVRELSERYFWIVEVEEGRELEQLREKIRDQSLNFGNQYQTVYRFLSFYLRKQDYEQREEDEEYILRQSRQFSFQNMTNNQYDFAPFLLLAVGIINYIKQKKAEAEVYQQQEEQEKIQQEDEDDDEFLDFQEQVEESQQQVLQKLILQLPKIYEKLIKKMNEIQKDGKAVKIYINTDVYQKGEIQKLKQWINSLEDEKTKYRFQFYRMRLDKNAEQIRRDEIKIKDLSLEEFNEYHELIQQLLNGMGSDGEKIQISLVKVIQSISDLIFSFERVKKNKQQMEDKLIFIKYNEIRQIMDVEYRNLIENFSQLFLLIDQTFPKDFNNSEADIQKLIHSSMEGYRVFDWKKMKQQENMDRFVTQFQNLFQKQWEKKGVDQIPYRIMKKFVFEYVDEIQKLMKYFEILFQSQNLFSDQFTQFMALKVGDENDYLLEREVENYFDRIFFNIFNFIPNSETDDVPNLNNINIKKSQQYSQVWMQSVQRFPSYKVAYFIHFIKVLVQVYSKDLQLLGYFLFPRFDVVNTLYLFKKQDEYNSVYFKNQFSDEDLNRMIKGEEYNFTQNEMIRDETIAENLLNSFPVFVILQSLEKISKPEKLQENAIVNKVENIKFGEKEKGQIENFFAVSKLSFINLLSTSYEKKQQQFKAIHQLEGNRKLNSELYFNEALNLTKIFLQYLNDNHRSFDLEEDYEGEWELFSMYQVKPKYKEIIQDLKFGYSKMKTRKQKQVILTIQVHCLIEAIYRSKNEKQKGKEDKKIAEAGGFNVNQGVNIIFQLEKFDRSGDFSRTEVIFVIIFTFYKIIKIIVQFLLGEYERRQKIEVKYKSKEEQENFYDQGSLDEVLARIQYIQDENQFTEQKQKLKQTIINRMSRDRKGSVCVYDQFNLYFSQYSFMVDLHLQSDQKFRELTGQRRISQRQQQLVSFYQELFQKKSQFDNDQGVNRFQKLIIDQEKLENRFVSVNFSGGLGSGFFDPEPDLEEDEDENEGRSGKSVVTKLLGVIFGRISVYRLDQEIVNENEQIIRMIQIMQVQKMTVFFNTVLIDVTQYVEKNERINAVPIEINTRDIQSFQVPLDNNERKREIVNIFQNYVKEETRFYCFTNVENFGQFRFNNIEAWDILIQEKVDVFSKQLNQIFRNQLNCQQIVFLYFAIKILQVVYWFPDIQSVQDFQKFIQGQFQYFGVEDRLSQIEKRQIFQNITSIVDELLYTKGVNLKQKIEEFSEFMKKIYDKNQIQYFVQQVTGIFILNVQEQKEMKCKFHLITLNFVYLTGFEEYYILGWNGHIDVIYGESNVKEIIDLVMKYQVAWKKLPKISVVNSYLVEGGAEKDKQKRVKRFEQKKKKFSNQVIVFYDFETNIEGSMLPYLVCFCFKIYAKEDGELNQEFIKCLNVIEDMIDIKKREDLFNGENFISYSIQISENGNIKTDEDLCNLFIETIKVIGRMIYPVGGKVKVLAHNAAKFDGIILLKHIFKKWGAATQVFGTLSNPKCVVVENISFQCSLVMSQLGGLDAACGPKGLDLKIQKIDSGEMKNIRTREQFIFMDNLNKEKIIKYCCFDVYMLQKMMTVFNETMIDIFNKIFSEIFEDEQIQLIKDRNGLFILKLSLPSTIYEFFSNYLVEPGQQLVGVPPGHYKQYIACQMAKRGGYTEIHNSKFYKFHQGVDEIVHGVDVCSMYPYQMSKTSDSGYFPYGYEKNFQKMGINQIMKSFNEGKLHFYIDPKSIYFVTYYRIGDGLQGCGNPILIKDLYDEYGNTVPDSGLFSPIEFGDPDFEVADEQLFNNLFLLTWEKKNWQNFFIAVTGETIIFLLNMGKRYDKDQKTIIKAQFFLPSLPQARDGPKFNPFKTFITKVYQLRLQAKQKKQQSYQLCLKTIMNSLYGYLIQNEQFQFFIDGKSFYNIDLKAERTKEWKRQVQVQIFERIAFILQKNNEPVGRKVYQNSINQFKYKEIYKLFDSHIHFEEVPLTDGIIKVKVESSLLTPSPGHSSQHAHLAVFITSDARQELCAGNLLLKSLDFKPLLNDTDSIYFLDEKNMGVDRVMQRIQNQYLFDYSFGRVQYKKKFEFGGQLGQWTINDGNEQNQKGNNIGYAMFWAIAKKFYICFTTKQAEKAIEFGKYEGVVKTKGVSGKQNLQDIQKSFFQQIMSEKSEGQKMQIMMSFWKRSGLCIQQVQIPKLIDMEGKRKVDEKSGDRIAFQNIEEKRRIIEEKQKQEKRQMKQIYEI